MVAWNHDDLWKYLFKQFLLEHEYCRPLVKALPDEFYDAFCKERPNFILASSIKAKIIPDAAWPAVLAAHLDAQPDSDRALVDAVLTDLTETLFVIERNIYDILERHAYRYANLAPSWHEFDSEEEHEEALEEYADEIISDRQAHVMAVAELNLKKAMDGFKKSPFSDFILPQIQQMLDSVPDLPFGEFVRDAVYSESDGLDYDAVEYTGIQSDDVAAFLREKFDTDNSVRNAVTEIVLDYLVDVMVDVASNVSLAKVEQLKLKAIQMRQQELGHWDI